VAEQGLDRAEIRACHQQVRGEGVAKSVTGDSSRDLRLSGGPLYRALQGSGVDMETDQQARDRVARVTFCREEVLPAQIRARSWRLPVQRVRQVHHAKPLRQVPLVDLRHPIDLALQLSAKPFRENRRSVLLPLRLTYHDHAISEVDILNPQPHAFLQPKSASIEQSRHQSVRHPQVAQERSDISSRAERSPQKVLEILRVGDHRSQL
jgi:hypothetical protein